MPSAKGPRLFSYRSSSPQYLPRKSLAQIVCLLIGISGLLFGFVAISKTFLGQNSCKFGEPRSVSVVWKTLESNDDGGGDSEASLLVGDGKRYKVMGFVGIFTGFGSVGRRHALRQTWLPSDRDGLQRLEEATGLAFRFIIGRTSQEWKMSKLKAEVSLHDDFILLDIEEEYSKLPYKTLAFFKAAYALFDSEFYVKADDDIYLRPDRLSHLLAKERSNPQTYIGCMKKGPVFTDPNLKWGMERSPSDAQRFTAIYCSTSHFRHDAPKFWYEPLAYMLGKEYFLHAYGPIYALSAKVVKSLVSLRNDSFRMFSNEDVTIGSWMLAMNVNHENNHALCSSECTSSSIAVWDIPRCSGLCNPEKKMLELHKMQACSGSPSVHSDE